MSICKLNGVPQSLRPLSLFVIAALIVAGATTPAPAATPGPLMKHASKGQFEQVLQTLTRDWQGDRPAAVGALIDDLERFKANKAKRMKTQRQAFKDAKQRIEENLADDDLADAMVAAVEAKQVAPDPWKRLNEADPDTRAAVKRTEKAAQSALANEKWIEALNHYQLLDTLFEKRGKYRAPLERVRRHVRVLQMYAPEALRKLQDAYAERQAEKDEDDDEKDSAKNGSQGESSTDKDRDAENPGGDAQSDAGPAQDNPIEDAPADQLQFTSWKKQLRDIRPTMLRQALRHSSREHISGTGYRKLLQGAAHGLDVLLATDQLTNTFPEMKNDGEVKQFRQHLADVQQRMQQRKEPMQYHDAASVIDGILAVNRQTLDLPTRVVVFELTDGAMSELDDFSSVIWPQDLSQFNRSIEGNFTGVGIQISRRDGELVVVTPLPETPAYQAGIRAGDIIAEVDGEDASRWSLQRAVREITGPKGSVVTLSIKRTGVKELIDFDIERAQIEIETIRGWRHQKNGDWSYWLDKNAGIGYIRMSQFMKQTAKDLDKAVARMQKQQPIEGLILDLRYNPGGLLSAAEDVADRFIEKGAIVSTVDAAGNRNTKHSATKRGTYKPFPVVVLVNDASASASEIVAGALQSYDRAFVIGSRSFGKGSVQDLFPLVRRKAYLKLTTQYYMLPDGRIIHRKPGDETWGIEPDLSMPMTNEQRSDAMEMRQDADVVKQKNAKGQNAERTNPAKLLNDGVDPQLEAALLYMQTRLVADDVAIAKRLGKKPAN